MAIDIEERERDLRRQIVEIEAEMEDQGHAWFLEVADDVQVDEATWEQRKVDTRERFIRLLALDMAIDELHTRGAIVARISSLTI